MDRATRYPIPAGQARIEYPVSDSRFIATGEYVPTVEAAEGFIERVRAEFPDATHNCFAYRVGYRVGVVERMSDDGEPSGTAGRPMIAVLKGQDLGDVAVVVTRYFGGTKLGTGGLVRAYSGAVRELLARMPVVMKVERVHRELSIDYSRYELLRRFIQEREGEIVEEQFAADVTIRFTLPVDRVSEFDEELFDLTHGQVVPTTLETS